LRAASVRTGGGDEAEEVSRVDRSRKETIHEYRETPEEFEEGEAELEDPEGD